MQEVERRGVTMEGDTHRGLIQGWPIVFGSRSLDLGGFVEIVDPSAVDRTLRARNLDVFALAQHDDAKVLARTSNGTLRLQKDARGVRADISVDSRISYANDLLHSVARGDVRSGSFGFRTLADSWRMDGGTPVRTLLDIEIIEVSIVARPAYPATDFSVAQRSLQRFLANDSAASSRGMSVGFARAKMRALLMKG